MQTNNSTTKKVKRLRGSASIREDGNFTFTPYGEGESQREEIRSVRKSRSYRTCGEKQQSIVAHLTVSADTKDPAYELYNDFREITKDMGGFERIPAPVGKMLEKNDDFRLTMNQAQGRIECSWTIDLREHADFMKQFYELLNQQSRCLYYNEDFLRQQCRVLAKRGAK